MTETTRRGFLKVFAGVGAAVAGGVAAKVLPKEEPTAAEILEGLDREGLLPEHLEGGGWRGRHEILGVPDPTPGDGSVGTGGVTGEVSLITGTRLVGPSTPDAARGWSPGGPITTFRVRVVGAVVREEAMTHLDQGDLRMTLGDEELDLLEAVMSVREREGELAFSESGASYTRGLLAETTIEVTTTSPPSNVLAFSGDTVPFRCWFESGACYSGRGVVTDFRLEIA